MYQTLLFLSFLLDLSCTLLMSRCGASFLVGYDTVIGDSVFADHIVSLNLEHSWA